jgi:gamma-glutamyltranspeptidase/glutathione hydrolase
MGIQHSSLVRFLILFCLCALLTAPLAAAPLRPTHAPHAIVASIHELASRAGIEMLRSGGNAVDAAVATGFALAVVHPQAGNLGGGGFLLLRSANGKVHFIDFREQAPAAATENMYLDAQGNVIPESSKDSSVVGYKSIGVPGTVAGLVYAEKQYGKLSLAKVIAPAIKLARDGFPLAYEDTQDLKKDEYLAQFPETKRIFLRNGNYYQPGELFKQPELARTLERIAKNPDDFYHGAMARELAAAIHKGGGLVTAASPFAAPIAATTSSALHRHPPVE